MSLGATSVWLRHLASGLRPSFFLVQLYHYFLAACGCFAKFLICSATLSSFLQGLHTFCSVTPSGPPEPSFSFVFQWFFNDFTSPPAPLFLRFCFPFSIIWCTVCYIPANCLHPLLTFTLSTTPLLRYSVRNRKC